MTKGRDSNQQLAGPGGATGAAFTPRKRVRFLHSLSIRFGKPGAVRPGEVARGRSGHSGAMSGVAWRDRAWLGRHGTAGPVWVRRGRAWSGSAGQGRRDRDRTAWACRGGAKHDPAGRGTARSGAKRSGKAGEVRSGMAVFGAARRASAKHVMAGVVLQVWVRMSRARCGAAGLGFVFSCKKKWQRESRKEVPMR